MIAEGLMQVGSWNLKLDDAPRDIRRKFGWFSNIVITAGRIKDPNIDRDDLVAIAKYSGVILKRNLGEGAFGGLGLLSYLQTGRGHAGKLGGATAPSFPATFEDFVIGWMGGDEDSNGITAGTDYSAITTDVDSFEPGTFWPPTKPILDEVAAQTGNEYRLNHDGSMDYGIHTALYPSYATPNVLIAPGFSGHDDKIALSLDDWSVNQDLMDFRNFGIVASQDGSTAQYSLTSGGSLMPLYGWGGSSAGQIRYFGRVNGITNDTSDLATQADALGEEFADVNYRIECSVDEFCVPTVLSPGDYVYVYDPDNDITGGAEITHFGRTIFALRVRCYGYTWPIKAGMGVYVIDNATQAITDVSDFVRWETGSTRIELGSPPKRPNYATTNSRFK